MRPPITTRDTSNCLSRSYSTNSNNGTIKNIYTRDNEALTPGGSSGGSAVAVATDQCDAYVTKVAGR